MRRKILEVLDIFEIFMTVTREEYCYPVKKIDVLAKNTNSLGEFLEYNKETALNAGIAYGKWLIHQHNSSKFRDYL